MAGETQALENSLKLLECNDPRRRKEGLKQLASVSDSRALRIAQFFLHDENLEVQFEAKLTCKILADRGVKPKFQKVHESPPKVQLLFSNVQIADEVCFVVQKNLNQIIFATLKTGLPKLFLIFYIFYTVNLNLGSSPQFQGIHFTSIFVLYAVFWRPVVWLSVGNAILRGFPEKNLKFLSQARLSAERFWAFISTNAFKLFLLAIPLFLIYSSTVTYAGASFILGLGGIILFGLGLYALTPLLPLQLIHGMGPKDTIALWSNLFSAKKTILWETFFLFLFGLGVLYLIIFANFSLFGNYLGIRLDFNAEMLPFLLLADLFLDPLWIAYQILVTRVMEKS